MKKRLLAAAVAATLTLATGVAMAAPVELDGSVAYQYRANTQTDKDDTYGGKFTVLLNAKANLEKNLDFYGRLAAQDITKRGFGYDFSTYQGDGQGKKTVAAVDQFGFIYNNAGVEYKLGRQALTVGGTGLLFDNTGNLGLYTAVDGINVTGKAGVTDLNLVAVQENNHDDASNNGDKDNRIYALHGSYSPAKDLTLGATVARYDRRGDDPYSSTNHYAINAAYNFGKATAYGEYAKSSADSDSIAYDLGVSYAFDSKNNLSVTNFKVDTLADLGGAEGLNARGTTFDNGQKGFYYNYNHTFTKDTSMSLFYKDNKLISDSSNKNTSFRATVNYNF